MTKIPFTYRIYFTVTGKQRDMTVQSILMMKPELVAHTVRIKHAPGIMTIKAVSFKSALKVLKRKWKAWNPQVRYWKRYKKGCLI